MADIHIQPRVILIIGKTASGKSALAVKLAKSIGSIIISADAFQVYRDFRVASDKITCEEMEGVEHVGLDLVEPTATFTVRDFMTIVLPVIEAELQAGRSPIIVGGTNMYIEKLLFTSRLDDAEAVEERPETAHRNLASIDLSKYTYERLKEIDPMMADRVHPNDTRRISRAIEYFEQTGTRMSEKLRNQERRLRWPHMTIIQKVASQGECQTHQQVELKQKIRDRVIKKMVDTGGLREEIFRISEMISKGQLRWNKGMLQAIGYREFQPFVEAISTLKSHITKDFDSLFDDCIEQVIRNTIRYARQQGKWLTRLGKYLNVHSVVCIEEIYPHLLEGHPQPALKPGAQVPQWHIQNEHGDAFSHKT
jgi:tRNA dimethylallyltransferase